jgi:hypothetical protein
MKSSLSKIILAAMFPVCAACGGSGGLAGSGGTGSSPAVLVGKWIERGGSGSSYYDPGSGSYGSPNSSTFEYVFDANGKYTHSALLISSLYSCSMQIFGYEQGSVLADGTGLTLAPTYATVQVKYTAPSCGTDETRTGNRDNKSYPWRIRTGPDGVKQLVLIWSNGWEEVFVPE